MKELRVSVCIEAYDGVEFLAQAVESVLEQSLADFELIILHDGASQDAERWAARDARVSARPGNRQDQVGSRNAVLQLARGECVQFLRADDYLCAPHALERMTGALAEWPGLALVACATRPLEAAALAPLPHSDRIVAGTTLITRCLGERRNLVGTASGVMFKRQRALRGFDKNFKHAADLEMWCHLLEQGAFRRLEEPLCASRRAAPDAPSHLPDELALLRRYLPRRYVDIRPWRKLCLLARAQQARRHWLVSATDLVLRGERWMNRRLVSARSAPLPRALPHGVNVVGFLSGEYGIGTSSRAWARAASDSGLPCALVNVRSKVHSNSDATLGAFSRANPYAVNLMTFSADYARRFLLDAGRRFFAGRRNIAIWFWEVEKFPARYHNAFDWHDEIWVATKFCEDALRAVSPVPVHRIPFPYFGCEAQPQRASFGIAPDDFAFLFNFDFYSLLERKNPFALVDAFRRAFSPRDKVVLIMKTINSERNPQDAERFRRAIQGLRVLWIEPHLRAERMDALFASCDCYVSLHRSEGLGLGMVQAMGLGKPVIATGWSGNVDFMDETNSRLVRHRLVELDRDHGPYEKGSHWAEPDVDHAAQLMRWAFEEREAAQALGQRAADSIRQTLAPARVSALIRERLS